MIRPIYDFYRDMLETHAEIGYLLVIVVALALFDGALAIAVWRWPVDDVYLVPGVDRCGRSEVVWGVAPPGDAATAVALPIVEAPRIELGAAAGAHLAPRP
ncbi:MAG TPA: hypothetical protein VEL07_22290 [Planctomycetota bacterium]|nr:hypothetical protein [Planctomycetota bacterium]